MREIKFRVWDITNKTMTGQMWPKMAINSNGTFGFPQDDLYVLMQYTGLKDKNGKEIYEGDIVKIGDEHNVVEWGEGFYEGYYGYAGIVLRDIFEVNTDSIGAAKWEVIGNIYENPELLEDK